MILPTGNFSRGAVPFTPLQPKAWFEGMPDEISEGDDIVQEDAFDPEAEIGDGADEEDED